MYAEWSGKHIVSYNKQEKSVFFFFFFGKDWQVVSEHVFFFFLSFFSFFFFMFFFLPESVDYLHFLVSLGYAWSSDQILPLGMWQDQ